MKPLAELDHYEVLEVPRDAGPEEIERAYRLVRSAYSGDSVAAYSLFEAQDAEALRERIDTAYRVLSDPGARREYDAAWKGEPAPAHEPVAGDTVGAEAEPQMVGFDEVEMDEEGAQWDGARLRRARLARGLEIEQITRITKVNVRYLTSLEEEQFEDLPAAVYVRGFVMAYARCLRLDGARVAASYMQRHEAQLENRPRSRLLERLGGL